MDLGSLWFLLIAFLFIGYFILEGFDFGVGILLPFLGKSDHQKRVLLNTIGPHWDGNEVWLITAGAMTFAAFPDWYATLFSGFYLPLLLILVTLILRGVAFEFRSKDENPIWRNAWDWAIFIGSFVPSFLWGVAFSNIVKGVPIDQNMQYVGGFWNLINLYAITGGLFTLIAFTLQGAIFLTLKTDGNLLENSKSVARKLWIPNVMMLLVFTIASFFVTDIVTKPGYLPELMFIAAILLSVCAGWLIKTNKMGSAFVLTSGTIAAYFAAMFLSLYPRLMVSSLNPLYSLTIANSASGPKTLAAMSVIALIFLPLVLVYQGWSYWIFRNRVSENSRKLEY